MDWVQTIAQYTVGLIKFLFSYCPSPPLLSDLVSQYMSSPCSVQCGIVSYLAAPGVVGLLGILMIGVGGMGILSLVLASVLSASLTLLYKILSTFSRAQQPNLSFLNLSPFHSLVLIVLGGLFSSNTTAASEMVNAILSMAMGLLMSGVLFIVGVATTLATGSPPCG